MIRATLLHMLLPLTVSSVVQPAEQPQVARGCCPRRGPRPCLFWLHVQKTGTAFGATLAAVGCPEQPKHRNVRKWSDACSYALGAGSHTHTPYIRERPGLGTTVTLIRTPRARLVSAYLFGQYFSALRERLGRSLSS